MAGRRRQRRARTAAMANKERISSAPPPRLPELLTLVVLPLEVPVPLPVFDAAATVTVAVLDAEAPAALAQLMA